MSARPIGLAAMAIFTLVFAVKLSEAVGRFTDCAPNAAEASPPIAAPAVTPSPPPTEIPNPALSVAPSAAPTVAVDGPSAFSLPVPGLDRDHRRAFSVGNALFRDNWVPAPSSAEGRDGLGPLFAATSCSACHMDDGRGRPPMDDTDRGTGMVVFVSATSDPALPHPLLGAQLQDQATPGVEPEGAVRLVPADIEQDGASPLLAWRVEVCTAAGEPIRDVLPSVRMGPQLIGLGLLEAVDDATIREWADPDDRDGDGISGRVHARRTDGVDRIGRFGWKATQPTLEEQVAAALHGDMGLTSSRHPQEPWTDLQRASIVAPSGGEPEVDDLKVQRLAHYCRVLAVPAQRRPRDPEVVRGGELFQSIGCAACHRPSLRTGRQSPIPSFRDVQCSAYTDLLLHDMGAGLADGRPDGDATGSEWRTPPLWGLGLIEAVNGHTRLLHDGRARSIDEAIRWHGGEAERSLSRFMTLTDAERRAIIAFVRSL